MPILALECPDCGHVFEGTVLAGTKPPEIWVCSRCGGQRAARQAGGGERPHPWETAHSSGCACCG